LNWIYYIFYSKKTQLYLSYFYTSITSQYP